MFHLNIKIMANLDINVLYEKYEYLRDRIGAENLLEDFVQQMTSNQLQDLLEDAYKNADIPFDDEDEDEEW